MLVFSSLFLFLPLEFFIFPMFCKERAVDRLYFSYFISTETVFFLE
ncbi:hypothetical protein LEP1GSC199_3250 [Leptospira vanthielii serovar Holland str. Waz Holland = ATCC 700522]|uniref:Uncharacterized protein n=1 Tax=Leptospira vanthielii serovar Holland str. Waz Holland = ATCC 700522 TaxID=1218591 RepID=N1WAC3_9LEPT|nr:hypothetical protein LEP1GSC199_3250 [Leptospira vanthielii serovar Holland str. Waz Holland = ATCC 700522]